LAESQELSFSFENHRIFFLKLNDFRYQVFAMRIFLMYFRIHYIL